jgi:phosphomannomutase
MAADPDPTTREELAAVVRSGDEALLADHVGRGLRFGTAGLRGPLGAGPNRMNRLVARRTAAGLARVLVEGRAAAEVSVVVGHDARHRSDDLAHDVVDVLSAHGLPVLRFDGPVPTPLLAVAVRLLGAGAGVMVTASHNPAADNGIKVYLDDGAQLRAPFDGLVARAVDVVAAEDPAVVGTDGRQADVTDLGTATRGELADAYVRRALDLGDGRPRPSVALALTALHGVGAALTDRVLGKAGHGPLHWVPSQREPDADFPTVPYPNPEEPGVMDEVTRLGRQVRAVAALALDPDADRLAVAAPDREGTWRTLTGDEVGALLAEHLLTRNGAAHAGRFVATTVVSSRLVHRIGAAHGVPVVETLTGFKWLSRPGIEHPDREQVLLYEEALGYAVGPDTRDKDGITAALVVADLVSRLAASGRTLHDLLDDLARRHGAHVTRNGSLAVTGPGWEDRLARLLDRVVAAPPERLGGRPVVRSDRPAQDVIRFWNDEDTRVALRPSGTEPKLKHYCEAVVAVADGDLARARDLAARRLDAVVADLAPLLG